MDPTQLIKKILSRVSYEILGGFTKRLNRKFENYWKIAAITEILINRLAPDLFLKILDCRKENQRRLYAKFSKIEPFFGIIFTKYRVEGDGCYCESILPGQVCQILTFNTTELVFNKVIDKRYVSLPMDVGFFLPFIPGLQVQVLPIDDLTNCRHNYKDDGRRYAVNLRTLFNSRRFYNSTQPICLIVVSIEVFSPIVKAIKEFILENSGREVAVWGGIDIVGYCKKSVPGLLKNTSFCSDYFGCTIVGLVAPDFACSSMVVDFSFLRDNDREDAFKNRLQQFRLRVHLKKHNVGLIFGSGCNNQIKSYVTDEFEKTFDNPKVPLVGCFSYRKELIGTNSFLSFSKELKIVFKAGVSLLIISYDTL